MKEQSQSPREINFSFLYLIIFFMNKSLPDYVIRMNIVFRGIFNELKKSFRPNKQIFSYLSIWWLAFTLSLKEMWNGKYVGSR